MLFITVVDDRFGMAFNGRRQSRDRVLCEKILSLAAGKRLWMNTYSGSLFEESDNLSCELCTDDFFLDRAGEGDFCFAETVSAGNYEANMEKIYLFKWNRRYPGDVFFEIDLRKNWYLENTGEFEGSSHERITLEVYKKGKEI